MNKNLLRLISLMMMPCLLANTSTAAAMNTSPYAAHSDPAKVSYPFTSQALASRLPSIFFGKLSNKYPSLVEAKLAINADRTLSPRGDGYRKGRRASPLAFDMTWLRRGLEDRFPEIPEWARSLVVSLIDTLLLGLGVKLGSWPAKGIAALFGLSHYGYPVSFMPVTALWGYVIMAAYRIIPLGFFPTWLILSAIEFIVNFSLAGWNDERIEDELVVPPGNRLPATVILWAIFTAFVVYGDLPRQALNFPAEKTPPAVAEKAPSIETPPLRKIEKEADPVRITSEIIDQILDQAQKAGKNETGGAVAMTSSKKKVWDKFRPNLVVPYYTDGGNFDYDVRTSKGLKNALVPHQYLYFHSHPPEDFNVELKKDAGKIRLKMHDDEGNPSLRDISTFNDRHATVELLVTSTIEGPYVVAFQSVIDVPLGFAYVPIEITDSDGSRMSMEQVAQRWGSAMAIGTELRGAPATPNFLGGVFAESRARTEDEKTLAKFFIHEGEGHPFEATKIPRKRDDLWRKLEPGDILVPYFNGSLDHVYVWNGVGAMEYSLSTLQFLRAVTLESLWPQIDTIYREDGRPKLKLQGFASPKSIFSRQIIVSA